MSGTQGFPKSSRLIRKNEIDRVFRHGRYHRLGMLQAKTLASDQSQPRFMVSVRKSIGSAFKRNRIKRVVKEAIRLNQTRLMVPHDVCVFITNRPRHPIQFSVVETEIQRLFDLLSETGSFDSPDG